MSHWRRSDRQPTPPPHGTSENNRLRKQDNKLGKQDNKLAKQDNISVNSSTAQLGKSRTLTNTSFRLGLEERLESIKEAFKVTLWRGEKG